MESQKKTQKQDLLGLGWGEAWGQWMETQRSVEFLARRNPHSKKCLGCFLTVTGCSWSTCCVSGPTGQHGDQADVACHQGADACMKEAHIQYGIPLKEWRVPSAGRRDAGNCTGMCQEGLQ